MDALLNSGFLDEGLVLEVKEAQASVGLLTLLLDELACGIMVVSHEGQVMQANNAARTNLAQTGLLQPSGQVWLLLEPDQAKALQEAFVKAAAGGRSLLTLAGEAGKITLVVIPLAAQAREPARVALVFSRSSVQEPVMLGFFARSHGLTATEEHVLAFLCQGYSAPEIAGQMKVAVSTVRTHVRSVCAKTRSCGIRELVNRVAVLPPITTATGAAMGQDRVH